MLSQANETHRRGVIVKVISRLGEENLKLLKFHLKNDYSIDLDYNKDPFTIEELGIALQRYLGENGAKMITREIQYELHLTIS